MQADALEIEALAKRRLADEYDAAQERGEVRKNGERSFSSPEKLSGPEILPPKELHEARQIRDAEKREPATFAAPSTRRPFPCCDALSRAGQRSRGNPGEAAHRLRAEWLASRCRRAPNLQSEI
jgi:hypothetical protein